MNVDWSKLISDLECAGLSQPDIGRRCGYAERSDRGKVWVNQLKRIPGRQPKFQHGWALVDLWVRTTKPTIKRAKLLGISRRLLR